MKSDSVDMALLAEGKMSKVSLEKLHIDSYFWYIWVNRAVGAILMAIVGYNVYLWALSRKNKDETPKEE